MKSGKTLTELAQAIQDQQARKHDYVLDSRELQVLTVPRDTPTDSYQTEVRLPDVAELTPEHLFHRQLGQYLGIRSDLYDRLQQKHPAQFDGLVNGLLGRVHLENGGKPQKRMVRSFTSDGQGGQGIARCLLSDSYHRIDNLPIAETILPLIAEIPGAEVRSCDLTDTKLYLKVVAPNMSCNLKDLISPSHHEFLPEGPDTIFPGFVVQNSEVGAGALDIQSMLFRVVCRNGLIRTSKHDSIFRRIHVGTKITAGEDYSIYSNEALEADDRALLLKVRDAVRHAVDETKFHQLAQQFAGTIASEPMVAPVEAMTVLAQRTGLTDGERESVLDHLIKGGDLTQFGAINALTAAAQNVESYDRSTELEALGGDMVAWSESAWREIAETRVAVAA